MTPILLAANTAWIGLVIALWTKRLWETHYARFDCLALRSVRPPKGRQKNEPYDWQDRRYPRSDHCHRRGCVGICGYCAGPNQRAMAYALRQLLLHRTIDADHDAFDGGALLSVTERNRRIVVWGCVLLITRHRAHRAYHAAGGHPAK